MANPIKAFTYQLGTQEINGANGVVQHNAGWAIGVIPFNTPDTFSINSTVSSSAEAVKSRAAFMIEDCISLKVAHSMSTPFGTLEMMLKSGNYNYLGALFPGDFVFVWMNADRSKLDTVVQNFLSGKAANQFDSGLKFFGRVESVRKRLQITNSSVGTKQLVYSVSATGFQEFNTKVYITPFLTLDAELGFFQQLVNQWYQIIGSGNTPGTTNVQQIVKAFINIFMGTGPKNIQTIAGATPNSAFLIPRAVGAALGRVKQEQTAQTLKYTDILTLVQGIQNYSGTSSLSNNNPLGFIPALSANKDPDVRQYKTSATCTGENITYGQKWQDVPVWSILSQYVNSTVNQLYACMRVDVDGKNIVPTLIMRQIPFSTQEFLNRPYKDGGAKKGPELASKVTLFMSLPRWKPDPAMVLEQDLGRSNALRVNYVQVWGEIAGGAGLDGGSTTPTTSVPIPGANSTDYQTFQFNLGNRVVDKDDIKRSGLRPYVTSIPYDFPNKYAASFAPIWARFLGDWVVNGHLKTNGTVSLTGVSEPICIGDNFEWDGAVFHIEQVTHIGQINSMGMVTFRTLVSLSNGLSVNSDEITRYPDMDNQYRETLAQQDQARDGIYPGYTDETTPNSPKTDRSSQDFNRKPK